MLSPGWPLRLRRFPLRRLSLAACLGGRGDTMCGRASLMIRAISAGLSLASGCCSRQSAISRNEGTGPPDALCTSTQNCRASDSVMPKRVATSVIFDIYPGPFCTPCQQTRIESTYSCRSDTELEPQPSRRGGPFEGITDSFQETPSERLARSWL